ncbi:hypothetical protein [Acinetobacter sp.]|uniref:hypothetical protein n=1 Tax=Acinetobacter sp. TaxID=472 RepID=UPI00258A3251|nr:hypothetical protein [Acinetobacter sp.]
MNIGFKLVEGLGGWKVPLAYRCIDREAAEVIGINKITEHWNIQLRECTPEKQGLANVQARIVINAAGP